MAADIKAYHFVKGSDTALDAEFAGAKAYGRIRPGQTVLFWRAGLRWYRIAYSELKRIYRQVEAVYGKMCCGGKSFFIERLVLVRADGTELVLYIGDDMKKDAQALLEQLKEQHPELEYGKVE